jgi:aspartate racemase
MECQILTGNPELVVGVIGGLGPQATLDFFGKVLKHSGGTKDQDHIHIIIENNPKTPNRNDAIAGRGPSPVPELVEMARSLERAGADFVVMACNTAHAFEKEIRAALSIPFVSLVDELVDEVLQCHPTAKRVGILATQGSRDADIFTPAFARSGIEVLQLDDVAQDHFMELLYRIKAGNQSPEVRNAMRELGNALVTRGSDLLIAGCTEVPLVMNGSDSSKPMIDSTDVLARRCVSYARLLKPLPVPGRRSR